MPNPERRRWTRRYLPDSLLGRIVVVMALGVISAQLVGTLLWARQLRESARAEALSAGHAIALNAAGSIRFFRDLPPQFRPILIEQLRTMGGTRFFINVNKARVPVQPVEGNGLVDAVVEAMQGDLTRNLAGNTQSPSVAFAWPETLQVSDDGRMVRDLPDSWVEATLLLRPRPAPVLVIQAEFEPGRWLYLATTMPDPYFLENANPLTWDRVALQLVTLLTALVISVLLVRGLIRPLNKIASAANAFGSDTAPESVPETGTAELRRTARAFNEMQARIQGYLVDRERLFLGISHGLKTPIMRLKLRTELLDDDTLRAEFHEDLDDLDVMVKAALQSVKDTDIHENLTPVRLDTLLARLAQRPIHPDATIECTAEPVSVLGKPLALERALSNLLDNAVLYGERVQVRLSLQGSRALVEVRDFGPGIAQASMSAAFEPHVRLSHGQQQNRTGTGLGLGIARNIIQAHGGEIRLHNHAEGGLVVTVLLAALPAD
ncbi:MAG: HAMP domain-containing protein [Betaproteobacteria bacterium]|nr:HAMP domain-containing protein [Betaproteobacteria bacterium]